MRDLAKIRTAAARAAARQAYDMEIRQVRESDAPRLRELFDAQGFDYALPDFRSPEFMACLVVCDERDQPVLVVGARRTVELYLLSDPKWATPRWRLEALKLMHTAMQERLAQIGIQDAHIWIPPAICKSFGRRLMRCFGWRRQLWPSFSREV